MRRLGGKTRGEGGGLARLVGKEGVTCNGVALLCLSSCERFVPNWGRAGVIPACVGHNGDNLYT